MILDFTVKNFMSIKDTTTLDFVVPTDYLKEKDKPDPRIVKVDIQGGKKSIYVNKALVIYGANASGKSNILLAIHEFFRTIKNSINPEFEIKHNPFAFNDDTINQPTEMQLKFVYEKVEYIYSFSYNKETILEESLVYFPNGKESLIFERKRNEENETRYKIPSGKLTGGAALRYWKQEAQGSKLFLTRAAHGESKELKPIYEYLINLFDPIDEYVHSTLHVIEAIEEDNSLKDKIIDLLREADFSINNLRITKKKMSLPKDLPKELLEEIKKDKDYDENNIIRKNCEFSHNVNGKDYYLKQQYESVGTLRSFALALPFIEAAQDYKFMLADELGTHLHPYLTKFFIEFFFKSSKGSQAIFVTHDTYLLRENSFRRDQIVFCNRNEDLSSDFYYLIDFKEAAKKNNRINLEDKYLQGLYDAVPRIF